MEFPAGQPSQAREARLQPGPNQQLRDGIQNHQGTMNIRDVVFGGNHHHGSADGTPERERFKRALIGMLDFDTMNLRFFGVNENIPRTCEWLLKKRQWREWQQSLETTGYRRILWIKGHAGTGKSTYIKFAVQTARISEACKEGIVLAYFFNARAPDKLDRTTEGMYRTILVQLLRGLSSQEVWDAVPREVPMSKGRLNLGLLSNLFRDVIRKHNRRPITCFIDALDECDEKQVRDMIGTFRDLVQRSADDTQFRVCLSSRHCPHITVPNGVAIEFPLEQQLDHLKDIKIYIKTYLEVSCSPMSQLIRKRVQERADGSFIWCKYVIEILNKECDRGRLDREEVLYEKLDHLPRDLHELYSQLLGLRDESQVSSEETLLCVQWVLFHQMSSAITLGQLWWAIQRGHRPHLDTNELEELFSNSTAEMMRRYILDISKGLFEILEAPDKEPTTYPGSHSSVQVIHESVREFFLRAGGLGQLMTLQNDGDKIKDEDEVTARSHDKLREISFNEGFSYGAWPLTRLKWADMTKDDYKQFQKSLTAKNPMILYSTKCVVHANVAHRMGRDQSLLLKEFGRPEMVEQWLQLYLWAWDYDYIDFSWTQFSNDPSASKFALISILMFSNAEALLWMHYHDREGLGLASRFGLEPQNRYFFMYDHPGDGKVRFLQTFIEIYVQQYKAETRKHASLRRLADYIGFRQHEIGRRHDIHGSEDVDDTVLFIGTKNKEFGIFLVCALWPQTRDTEQLLTTWSDNCPPPQSFADFLLFVLNHVTHVEVAHIVDLEQTLCWAARHGYVGVTKILLEKFYVSPNAQKDLGPTPLHIAAQHNQGEIVEILLLRDDIHPDRRGTLDETPLNLAARMGHNDIVEMLLATGRVDVKAKDTMGRAPRDFLYFSCVR